MATRDFDIALEAGDCLLVYTDGLMEACGEDRQTLGEDGLLKIAAGLKATTPKDLAERLVSEVVQRYPAALSCDDVTVMVLKDSSPPSSISPAVFTAIVKQVSKQSATYHYELYHHARRRAPNPENVPMPDIRVESGRTPTTLPSS